MGVLFVTTLLSMATVTRGNPDPCVGLPIPQEASRSITNLELASIADIGRSDPNDSPSPLGISPDGKKIALVVRRGNPKTNSFCQQLLMLPVYGDGLPTELDRGGEFIRSTIELRGIAAWPAGYEAVTSPRWSPDGQAIAYLKKVNGLTQIWLVSAQAGGEARQVSHSLDDIEDFRWSADGGGFIIATRPGLRIAETEIDAEAAHGFLYDERFVPMVSDRPLPLAPIPVSYSKIDINGRGGRKRLRFRGQRRSGSRKPCPTQCAADCTK